MKTKKKTEPIKKYTLKCQECDNRFSMRVDYAKDGMADLETESLSPREEVEPFYKVCVDTKQWKNELPKIDTLSFEYTNLTVRMLLEHWWRTSAKSQVKKRYGFASHFPQGKLLCNKCYAIAKLKE